MILLQETHTENKNFPKVPMYTLAGYTADKSRHSYVRSFVTTWPGEP